MALLKPLGFLHRLLIQSAALLPCHGGEIVYHRLVLLSNVQWAPEATAPAKARLPSECEITTVSRMVRSPSVRPSTALHTSCCIASSSHPRL